MVKKNTIVFDKDIDLLNLTHYKKWVNSMSYINISCERLIIIPFPIGNIKFIFKYIDETGEIFTKTKEGFAIDADCRKDDIKLMIILPSGDQIKETDYEQTFIAESQLISLTVSTEIMEDTNKRTLNREEQIAWKELDWENFQKKLPEMKAKSKEFKEEREKAHKLQYSGKGINFPFDF